MKKKNETKFTNEAQPGLVGSTMSRRNDVAPEGTLGGLRVPRELTIVIPRGVADQLQPSPGTP